MNREVGLLVARIDEICARIKEEEHTQELARWVYLPETDELVSVVELPNKQ